jgi:hypothetical protein
MGNPYERRWIASGCRESVRKGVSLFLRQEFRAVARDFPSLNDEDIPLFLFQDDLFSPDNHLRGNDQYALIFMFRYRLIPIRIT